MPFIPDVAKLKQPQREPDICQDYSPPRALLMTFNHCSPAPSESKQDGGGESQWDDLLLTLSQLDQLVNKAVSEWAHGRDQQFNVN